MTTFVSCSMITGILLNNVITIRLEIPQIHFYCWSSINLTIDFQHKTLKLKRNLLFSLSIPNSFIVLFHVAEINQMVIEL